MELKIPEASAPTKNQPERTQTKLKTTINHTAKSKNRTERFTCLIVEDDSAFGEMLSQVVETEGGDATLCSGFREALSVIERQSFDLFLLDNHLPDGRGHRIFERLSRRNSGVLAIMITGEPELSAAVELTRNGLFDYLTKPVDEAALVSCLQRAKLRMNLRRETESEAIYAESPVMKDVLESIQQASVRSQAIVLLTGETGVGKEVVASELHRVTAQNSGSSGKFMAINCAAVPRDMFEAELFGSEKGAYTGADKRRTGLVEAAQNGTLFLDEITEMPMELQAKMLRFLESREYRPLGSTTSHKFSGRVIAATNRSLAEEVKAGRFREDLMFRINVFSIEIPPLRKRRHDLPGLTEHLLSRIAENYGCEKPVIQKEDFDRLDGYDFPGNVRELRNLLERSLLKMPQNSRWLQLDLDWLKGKQTSSRKVAGENDLPPGRELSPIELEEYRLIRQALLDANGGIRRTASLVGLTPQSLLRRLQKWPELHALARSSSPSS